MSIALCGFAATPYSYAGFEKYLENYKDEFISSDEGVGAEKGNQARRNTINYVYEAPTKKTLSLLYWAVKLYSLDDDLAVDSFVAQNECDIYKNFITDEFEWEKIRSATRNYIASNWRSFPTRFSFSMPLQLTEYDEDRNVFNIADDYQINSVRRFEFHAEDPKSQPCYSEGDVIYPKIVVLEFSRPLTFNAVPMEKNRAKKYVTDTRRVILKKHGTLSVGQRIIDESRQVALVFRVKIFTHGDVVMLPKRGAPAAQLYGVLEGYDVYEDSSKDNLLFSRSFTTQKVSTATDGVLQEQYDILREKSKMGGILH